LYTVAVPVIPLAPLGCTYPMPPTPVVVSGPVVFRAYIRQGLTLSLAG